ncbi:MAG: TMEM175 family protein [Anaerolineales bacterium]
MSPSRLEAYSDAVIAIIITIMVLELRPPGSAALADLLPVLPTFLSYVLSFVFLSIYWNNHHHLLRATKRINGAIMWANIHLLFWLSLIPFTTSWLSEQPGQTWPTALYGINLLMAAVAYTILTFAIIAHEGKDSRLASVVGPDIKGNLSLLFYVLSIGLAFVNTLFSYILFVVVALIWLRPDRRTERIARQHQER